MATHVVRAGRTALEPLASRPAVDAVVELIWNALDAEADDVSVSFERGSLGTDGPEFVSRISVVDNGHGIDPVTAVERFTSLGDSWKLGLSGRSINGKRVLHGRRGQGRFFAYALGYSVSWSTVWENPQGERVEYRIDGQRSSINEFSVTTSRPTTKAVGTSVDIRVEQGRPLSALLDDDLAERISARLAPHLLGNTDIHVRIDGSLIQPSSLIEAQPDDQPLDEVPPEDLHGNTVPVLRLIEWNDRVRADLPSLVLCSAEGASIVELERVRKRTLKVTGYVLWNGFEASHANLLVPEMAFGPVIEAARKRVSDYVQRRVAELKGSIVRQLVDEGSYPYPIALPSDPVERAEQQIYDMVLVAARTAIGTSKRERRLTARLMQIAVQERTNDVDDIIDSVLGLPPDTKEQLRDLLKDTTLSAIVKASSEVRTRVELILGLRRLLYSQDTARKMREVDQLHPLVRDHEWLFGEEWRLARSESSLTNVLRDVVPPDVLLEDELAATGGKVVRSDGTEGRVDLLFQRVFRGPSGLAERLVVELKRPSSILTPAHLAQVRSYARALNQHQGISQGHWTFWLVGTALDDDLLGDAEQRDRRWGHVDAKDNYDIHVTRWSDLIEQAETRLEFFRGQLSLEVSQDEATRRLRERHGALLPEFTAKQ